MFMTLSIFINSCTYINIYTYLVWATGDGELEQLPKTGRRHGRKALAPICHCRAKGSSPSSGRESAGFPITRAQLHATSQSFQKSFIKEYALNDIGIEIMF